LTIIKPIHSFAKKVVWVSFVFILSILTQCTPKGPITFSSPYEGQHKNYLEQVKGKPTVIRKFENSIAYIYITKEEYFGKSKNIELDTPPKKTVIIEYIYYINNEGIIYKYQVWKKKPIKK